MKLGLQNDGVIFEGDSVTRVAAVCGEVVFGSDGKKFAAFDTHNETAHPTKDHNDAPLQLGTYVRVQVYGAPADALRKDKLKPGDIVKITGARIARDRTDSGDWPYSVKIDGELGAEIEIIGEVSDQRLARIEDAIKARQERHESRDTDRGGSRSSGTDRGGSRSSGADRGGSRSSGTDRGGSRSGGGARSGGDGERARSGGRRDDR
jgi:hypothetical protein